MAEPDPRKMKSSIYRIWKKRKEKREERLRLLEETIPEYEEFERGIEQQGTAYSSKKKAVSYEDLYEEEEDEAEPEEEPCPSPRELNTTYVIEGSPDEGAEDEVYEEYYEDSLVAEFGDYEDSLEGRVADYFEDDSFQQGPVFYPEGDQYDSLGEPDDEYDSVEDRVFNEAYDSLDGGPLARGAAEVGVQQDSLVEFSAAVDRVFDMASAMLETPGGEEEAAEEDEEDEEDEEEDEEEDIEEEDEVPAEFRIHEEPERRPRVRILPVTLRRPPGFYLQQQGQFEPRLQFPPLGQLQEYAYGEQMQPFWLHEHQRYRTPPSPIGGVYDEYPCDEHQQGFWLH